MAVLTLLRQPKWIIFTLLVPVGMALCLLAANWQYNRHVNRSAEDARVRNNAQAPVVPIDTLSRPGAAFPAADAWRRVSITGVFASNGQLVRRKPLDGQAGFWVVNALRSSEGGLIQVVRGWVPLGGDATSTPTVPPPPAGTVTVTGRLQPSEAPRSNTGLPAGQLSSLDTSALAPGSTTYPGYLVAAGMTPADAASLKPLPVPEIGLGPHLAYSWQWLFFAALLPVGWVILARREIKEIRAEVPDEEPVAALR